MKLKSTTGYIITIISFMLWGCSSTKNNAKPEGQKAVGLGKYIYGADIDNWTEATKEEQRANAKEFLAKLDEAIKSGKHEITLDKKHYRFSPTSGTARQAFVTLRNVNDFTINGNGAQFWFESYKAGLSVENSKNITFNNLTIDWDPLPFSQFVVKSVGVDHLVGETESGFRNMTDILKGLRKPVLKIFVFDAKTGMLKPNVTHSEIDSIQELGGSNLKYYGRGYGGYKYTQMNIQPGDRIAIVMRHTHGVSIRGSENVKFYKFNMYSSPMFGITMGDGGGGLVLQDCKLIPRPDTKRVMGINGDAVHLTSLKKGPLIENSEFSAAGDDIVNNHGDFDLVQEQQGPKKIVVAIKNFKNISKGTIINIYDSKTYAPKGSFKVVNLEDAGAALKDDAKKIGKEKAVIFWPGNASVICELDKPVSVSRYDIVESTEDGGAGAIIRNNYLHNLTTRGFLVQTKNALIENNLFEHVDNAAIAIMASLQWCEAPFPDGITVRNNVIKNANIGLGSRYASHAKIGAISVNIEYTGALKQNTRPITNLVIENNKIYNSATAGIFIIHANNSRITGNLIDGFCLFDQLNVGRNLGVEPYAGIYIGDSEKINITGNTIVNGGKQAKENIIIGKYADKNSITIKN